MTSYNKSVILDLALTNTVSIMLASPEALQTDGRFDMAMNYSFDINIESISSVGTLSLFLQNDDPVTSTFTTTPYITPIEISGGTFADGKTKITIQSNGQMNTKFIGFNYLRTSGIGLITITGQITYI